MRTTRHIRRQMPEFNLLLIYRPQEDEWLELAMLADTQWTVYPEEVTRQLHVMAQARESLPVMDVLTTVLRHRLNLLEPKYRSFQRLHTNQNAVEMENLVDSHLNAICPGNTVCQLLGTTHVGCQ